MHAGSQVEVSRRRSPLRSLSIPFGRGAARRQTWSLLGRVELAQGHPVEAEEALLSAVLVDNDVLLDIIDVLQHNDFYRSSHQKIFAAITDLFDRGEPVVGVVQQLQVRAELVAYRREDLRGVHQVALGRPGGLGGDRGVDAAQLAQDFVTGHLAAVPSREMSSIAPSSQPFQSQLLLNTAQVGMVRIAVRPSISLEMASCM